jgi:AGCS family alanine or glycine:cation symporter
MFRILAAMRETLWGAPAASLMLLCGLVLTLRTRGIQFRRLGTALGDALGGLGRRRGAGAGEMSAFQTVAAALAATVGTGNIAGVSAALCLGGPGALFWMWAAALLGMGTKFGEILLALDSGRPGKDGVWRGGPMYYMERCPGGRYLGMAFALFGALAALGMGSSVQAGTVTETAVSALSAWGLRPARTAVGAAVGTVCAVSAGFTLLGGASRLGRVTEKLVPVMSAAYILACLGVLFIHREAIPGALRSILAGAFRPQCVTGGAVGSLVRAASAGVGCGVFSNEAGLGSAPIVYACGPRNDPVRRALGGVFEVFLDTVVLCTLTGLCILVSPVGVPYGAHGTAALNALVLGEVYGQRIGSLGLALCTGLFAVGTILSWSLYGIRCWEYLLDGRFRRPYLWAYVLACFFGAVLRPALAWTAAEILNGLMCLPNLAALLTLSGRVGKLAAERNPRKIVGNGGKGRAGLV